MFSPHGDFIETELAYRREQTLRMISPGARRHPRAGARRDREGASSRRWHLVAPRPVRPAAPDRRLGEVVALSRRPAEPAGDGDVVALERAEPA